MKFVVTALIAIILFPFSGFTESTKIKVVFGVDEVGQVTSAWPNFNNFSNPTNSAQDIKSLTLDEKKWADLIQTRAAVWPNHLQQIAIPYRGIEVPEAFTIVLGNRGNRDAFTHSSEFPLTIFFNLSVLVRSYGDSGTKQNLERIDRIFAHEYTHLLQHIWSEKHSYPITNHIEYALNQAFIEGVGHYRSISNKWLDEQGVVTSHAEKVLQSLEEVFVDRMILLKNASDEEAKQYTEDLSMGPFSRKWGALTVALWLAKEAKGNDNNLIKWVELGPNGILLLANRHLPERLKIKLNSGLKP